jgi:hypothetical protein
LQEPQGATARQHSHRSSRSAMAAVISPFEDAMKETLEAVDKHDNLGLTELYKKTKDVVAVMLALLRADDGTMLVELAELLYCDKPVDVPPQLVLIVFYRAFVTGKTLTQNAAKPFFDPVLFEIAQSTITAQGMDRLLAIEDAQSMIEYLAEVTANVHKKHGTQCEGTHEQFVDNLVVLISNGIPSEEEPGNSESTFTKEDFFSIVVKVGNASDVPGVFARKVNNILVSSTGHDLHPDKDFGLNLDIDEPLLPDFSAFETPATICKSRNKLYIALRNFTAISLGCCVSTLDSYHILSRHWTLDGWTSLGRGCDWVRDEFKASRTAMFNARSKKQFSFGNFEVWLFDLLVPRNFSSRSCASIYPSDAAVLAFYSMLSTGVVGGDSVFNYKNSWNEFVGMLPHFGRCSLNDVPPEILLTEILLKQGVVRWQKACDATPRTLNSNKLNVTLSNLSYDDDYSYVKSHYGLAAAHEREWRNKDDSSLISNVHCGLFDKSLFSLENLHGAQSEEWWDNFSETVIGHRYSLAAIWKNQKDIAKLRSVCKAWNETLKPASMRLEYTFMNFHESEQDVANSPRWKSGEQALPTVMRGLYSSVGMSLVRELYVVNVAGDVVGKKQRFPPLIFLSGIRGLKIDTKTESVRHIGGNTIITVQRSQGLQKNGQLRYIDQDISSLAIINGTILFEDKADSSLHYGFASRLQRYTDPSTNNAGDKGVSGLFFEDSRHTTHFTWKTMQTSKCRVPEHSGKKAPFALRHNPMSVSVSVINNDRFNSVVHAFDTSKFYVVSSSAQKHKMEGAKANRKRKADALAIAFVA